jgi:hypothetical protein
MKLVHRVVMHSYMGAIAYCNYMFNLPKRRSDYDETRDELVTCLVCFERQDGLNAWWRLPGDPGVAYELVTARVK